MPELIDTFKVAGIRVYARDGIRIEELILRKGFNIKMYELGIGYLILGFSGIPTALALMSLGLKANGIKDLAKPGDQFIYFYTKRQSGSVQQGKEADPLVFAGEVQTAINEEIEKRKLEKVKKRRVGVAQP